MIFDHPHNRGSGRTMYPFGHDLRCRMWGLGPTAPRAVSTWTARLRPVGPVGECLRALPELQLPWCVTCAHPIRVTPGTTRRSFWPLSGCIATAYPSSPVCNGSWPSDWMSHRPPYRAESLRCVGFTLFQGSPRMGHLALSCEERLSHNGPMKPSEEFPIQQVSIHGHDLAYRGGGQGPVLLLLHGIAGSSRSWIPAMQLLQRDYTVLAPDFLGHGESAKPLGDYSLGNHASTMRDFLHLLGIDRATVVGQSFGGGVAMQFAYQFPERCERLVLVDAGGLGREVSWVLRLLTLPAAEYVMPVVFPSFVRDWGNAVSKFLHDRGIRSARAAEMWRSYGSLTEPENRQAFVRTMRAVIDPGGQSVSAIDRLYLAAPLPTLIVWGDRDRIIPLVHAYKAHEALPNSRLEVMEGVGHFPQVEEPVRFVEILVDFLRTTEPSTVTPQ